ncbi:hypothetical protein M9H77_08679 [Catharanthus roseus]|uniref:Uncharacterized protein n=1 Tax=Catharanthus roseus TaxID=4058 RepID=A0ACC0BYS0_CATRO|nr:hypothetical protein M9H77_08679 [Catharanthus roseus]
MASDSAAHSISIHHKGHGNDLNAMQKHVMFFDCNKDGIIYPWETYKGFRAIGCGIIFSIAATIFIHIMLGCKTRPGKFFSPLLPIAVKNVKRGKHGSDSGVYDAEGRFIPTKFEEIFIKHAKTSKNALTACELDEMIKANRLPKDYKGWIMAYAEWKVLYLLCKDKHGLLQKETVRAAFDGSLFEQMARDHKSFA